MLAACPQRGGAGDDRGLSRSDRLGHTRRDGTIRDVRLHSGHLGRELSEQAERDLEQLKQHALITEVSVMEVTKKGYQSLVLMADIFSIAIPTWFNLLASAAIMAGETFAALATAETMTGWLAAKAMVTFSIAAMMFYRAIQLEMQASRAEDKLNSILQLANTWI